MKGTPLPGAVVAPPEPNILGCDDVLPNSDFATPLPALAADMVVFFWPNMEPAESTLFTTGALLAPNIEAELAGGAPNWKVLLVAALFVAMGGAAVLLVPVRVGAENPNRLADDAAGVSLGAPKVMVDVDAVPNLNMSVPPLTNGCVFEAACGPPADDVAAPNSDCSRMAV